MIHVKFKNLDKSAMAKEAVEERVHALVQKFSDLRESKIQVTLEMQNSPAQAGPDLFKVKFHISRGRYDGVTVEKSDANLYIALADVADHMLEALNRAGDRARVKERRKARELTKKVESLLHLEDKKVS
ncbi:MAG: HPF/RaiA family ribosome-associated protein [Bdellovibrio sp.]|nr:HPF/RaiA family ribosome-associated protein [Bdellovibrio sp.]